jgi:hypothetical protein
MEKATLEKLNDGHRAVVALLGQRDVLETAFCEHEPYGVWQPADIQAQIVFRMKVLADAGSNGLASHTERLHVAAQELGQQTSLHLAVITAAESFLESLACRQVSSWEEARYVLSEKPCNFIPKLPGSVDALEQELKTAL